ncbi:MAG: PIN domain nuclease [Rectinema sp.]|jgi:predicted nucleic acid-binding protein|uniref:Ribonuclease VapC n=1 Tax=uncultured spirochete TaxID=156406 RepID=A0A3P3XM73_9SPIR|nr:Ribonuclease VapC [uncultured spirochete]
MIIADTSVWIDYVRGINAPHTDLLDNELLHDRVATGDIIIVEFLQGFREEKDIKVAKQIMDRLEYYDFLGKGMALITAANYRKLREKGVTVRKTIDVIIGTFCIEKGFELLHNDRDFDPMEKYLGLKVKR